MQHPIREGAPVPELLAHRSRVVRSTVPPVQEMEDDGDQKQVGGRSAHHRRTGKLRVRELDLPGPARLSAGIASNACGHQCPRKHCKEPTAEARDETHPARLSLPLRCGTQETLAMNNLRWRELYDSWTIDTPRVCQASPRRL